MCQINYKIFVVIKLKCYLLGEELVDMGPYLIRLNFGEAADQFMVFDDKSFSREVKTNLLKQMLEGSDICPLRHTKSK